MGGNIFQHSQGFVDGALRPDLLPSGAGESMVPSVLAGFDVASSSGNWTLSENNHRATNDASINTEVAIRLDTSFDAADATYVEFEIVVSSGLFASVGITNDGDASLPPQWFVPAGGYLYYGSNGLVYNNGGSVSSGLGAYSNSAVIGICVKAGGLYLSNNGVWTGDPSAGTGALFTGLSGNFWPAIYGYAGLESIRVRLSVAEMSYPIPTGASTILP